MTRWIHITSASLAWCLILIFWSSTLVSETLGNPADIQAVKTFILYGMAILIPSIITAGISGFRLSCGRLNPLVDRKLKRMPIIALNGLLILLPSAVFLAHKADIGEFDELFYGVQMLELTAGLVNFYLMTLNARDGRRLSRPDTNQNNVPATEKRL
ncbi:hypothetical protein [Hydrogenovibrio thermophilus]|jgi:hypothetical protein|uniref:Transmembrane protein n=1 Tax=Hydrogenovibrio thermophilus TaxID=265883 RepID=A0A410H2E8_9GAMM|nr:hypothetical protein [Hydrogenovibrio thermophilus]QAB14980.1 hypothetical protein EPV75_04485 [Hydrogenovibrio thermophilus]